MSHDRAFLEEIRAHPHDDAPRLIYADWLEEHGQPERADFIRVQCELARPGLDPERRRALSEREQALWLRHGKAWARPLRPYVPSVRFHRGFLDRATLDAQRFIHQGDDLLDLTPLWRLHFRNARKWIVELAHCPALGRLHTVDLSNNRLTLVRPADWIASPQWRRLRALNLAGCMLGLLGARALASVRLDSLTELVLDGNGLGDAGAAALADAPWLGGLRTLGLAGDALGAAGVQALLSGPGPAGLEALDLSLNRGLGDAGLRALADARCLQRLTTLKLQHLYDPNRIPYGRSVLGEAGVGALADSPYLGSLARLDLSSNLGLDAGVLWALAHAVGLPSLRALDLCVCRLDPNDPAAPAAVAFRDLLYSPLMERLTSLRLDGNPLGLRGAAIVASSPQVRGLTYLGLSQTSLGDVGLRSLAASPNLTALEELDLRYNYVGNAGAQALAASPHLPRLRTVLLGRVLYHSGPRQIGIGERARKALRDRFGEGALL
jgi:uncharacterized protein (TIGR02996 family)